MNETMKPPALLEAAAALVQRALAQMDMTEVRCDTCSARHFRSRNQARVYENLSAVPSRLMSAAARLEEREYTAVSDGAAATETPDKPATDEPEHKRPTWRERLASKRSVRSVMNSEAKKRAAPWEGRGNRD